MSDVAARLRSSAVHFAPAQPEASYAKTTLFKDLFSLVARLAATEFVAVAATAYATSLLYFIVVFGALPPTATFVLSALFIASLILLVSLGFRHYAMLHSKPMHRFLWRGLGAVALAFSFFLSTLFLLKISDDYSRATFFIQFGAVAVTVLAVRAVGFAAIRSAIASGRVEARRAVVIGTPSQTELESRLGEAGVQIVRSLPFPGKSQFAPNGKRSEFDGELVCQMIETCRRLRPDDIVILATAADLQRSARLADRLSELPVSVHLVPTEVGELLLGSARLGELGALTTIQLRQRPLSGFDRLLKRGFDIVAASLGLLLLLPLLLIVAIAIRFDSRGPSLFRQTRHGYNNDVIRVFKFRSMSTMEDGQTCKQASKNDPRVTHLGRILRRTNIDELPQLLNVLLGEMSLVGPRPHPLALNDSFRQHIAPLSRRHNVKPGITGWAQVNGYRGETDTLEKMQRRFDYDLYYIDNWSFLLDMKIILMTLFSKRAYMNAL
jgi:Undecaprenyl-phosphate glucose phosphotransferase